VLSVAICPVTDRGGFLALVWDLAVPQSSFLNVSVSIPESGVLVEEEGEAMLLVSAVAQSAVARGQQVAALPLAYDLSDSCDRAAVILMGMHYSTAAGSI
jgi:hypothetical protein